MVGKTPTEETDSFCLEGKNAGWRTSLRTKRKLTLEGVPKPDTPRRPWDPSAFRSKKKGLTENRAKMDVRSSWKGSFQISCRISVVISRHHPEAGPGFVHGGQGYVLQPRRGAELACPQRKVYFLTGENTESQAGKE